MSELGYCEGDTCGRNGCAGVIESHEVENCGCHISPPCGACTSPRGHCESCGWEESEDPAPEPEQISQKDQDHWKAQGDEWDRLRSLPLDNTKVSWRHAPHSNSSMIKEGVYPLHMSRAEVESEVRGTFGGRFVYFQDGKFKYIAYID
ncbi:hypothetical protein [Pseudomonas capsici]|uniref:hypothetical protein n=1 Tax=Pseudomonas capsici TaxID=2810614 RepID=UPI0021F12C22|nr:hypothetical protein [Pseudomonas capsici]MCV4285058.1 hypothetical protein [Pseudomonas capsici]